MDTKRISRKYVIFYTVILAGLIVGSGCTQGTQVKQVKGFHWMGTWTSSAQEVESKLMPPEFQKRDDTTLRQVVRVSAGGNQLRVAASTAA